MQLDKRIDWMSKTTRVQEDTIVVIADFRDEHGRWPNTGELTKALGLRSIPSLNGRLMSLESKNLVNKGPTVGLSPRAEKMVPDLRARRATEKKAASGKSKKQDTRPV